MGNIVFWTIIRAAIVIPALWFIGSYYEIQFWWIISILSIYGIIIHPAIIQYKNFEESSKSVIDDTICSSCVHFDRSAVLCMKYDEHPTTEYIPCGGMDWEPK